MDFLEFQKFFSNRIIRIANEKLNSFIQTYSFYSILENFDGKINPEILKKIQESKVIIINQDESINLNSDKKCFFIGFEKTIIIIHQNSLKFLEPIFCSESKPSILFLSNTKDIFDRNFKIDYNEINVDTNFNEEIKNFNEQHLILISNNPKIQTFWKIIKPCISGYFILKSYYKSDQNRIENINLSTNDKLFLGNNFEMDDFILLRNIDNGSKSYVELYYYIEKEELVAIKKFLITKEKEKLIQREKENYLKIQHPLMPKFYGTIKNKDYLVIEYINGSSLLDIKNLNLDDNDKITIIFELMLILDYIHHNNLIFRDLKPNNVIIDKNKTAVLIDFDRMIEINSAINNEQGTFDLASCFLAEEVNSPNFQCSCDVYSLGKMIYYIIKEEIPKNDDLINKDEFNNIYSDALNIYNRCINENANKRPSISNIVIEFFISYHSMIKISNLTEKFGKYLTDIYDSFIIDSFNRIENEEVNPKLNVFLGFFFYEGKYVTQDINKAIHYFSLAAEENIPKVSFFLGCIYYQGNIGTNDIEKAIYYYKKAADLNYSDAQFYLADIYKNKYTQYYNINKAIYYYELAAKSNFKDAQKVLGDLYNSGEHIPRDINKSIYYYSLAATNHNDPIAEYNLGLIYDEGKNINQDLKKAFYYYSQSANQNFDHAQLKLGIFYIKGICVKQDAHKAINYFEKAANQNNIKAQFILGNIFSDGIFIKKDIKKAIYYYELASKNNHSSAQFNLASIYENGILIERDINKAIQYYILAAKNKNSKAMYNLGALYLQGENVPYDFDKGLYYLELSANQNNSRAQAFLGQLYSSNIDVKVDINKAIYYYDLAAKQNVIEAQINLGNIYMNGEYISVDINKAIYYYKMADINNNSKNAQFLLGTIYFNNLYIPSDIDRAIYYFEKSANQGYKNAQFYLGLIYAKNNNFEKAIHYYTLAANQNLAEAQTNLGLFYLNGIFVQRNVNKAISLLLMAEKQNNEIAQLHLGIIYESGTFVPQDINKAIHYYTLASKNNIHKAQLNLGNIYYNYLCNYNEAIYYFKQSAKNGNIQANFTLGYLYQEGLIIQQDYQSSLLYYKEASSFNYQYAKNNLGVIFKNGIENEISQNISSAIEYFEEGINQKNDMLCMYNLASTYFFFENNNIDKSIDLLLKSSIQGFYHSKYLLSLILIKKNQNNLNKINKEILKYPKELSNDIIYLIRTQRLNESSIFEKQYKFYQDADFIYNSNFEPVQFNKRLVKIVQRKKNLNNITSLFYEGFGISF